MRALVLGASGQQGRAVAAALLHAGWDVTAATGGGRALPAPLIAAGARHMATGPLPTMIGAIGGGVDLLFDPFCMTADDLPSRLAIAADVGRFVLISTASVYADAAGRGFETGDGFPHYDVPLTEDHPTVPPGPGYSAGKVGLERACHEAGLRAALLRPGAIHGAGARHPREWVVVKRILDGRNRMAVQGDGTNRFQTTSAANIAEATLTVAREGLAGPLNVGDPDHPRLCDIVAAVAAQMGRDLQLVPVSPAAGDAGHTPWSVPNPVVLDCGRLDRAGWHPRPYAATLPDYLDWLVAAGATDWRAAFPAFAHCGVDPFDYAAEDRALAAV